MTSLTHCNCGCIYEEVTCPNCNYKSLEDQVKELVKERDKFEALALMNLQENGTHIRRAEAAEAKLTKAVEALREIEADCDADYPPSHGAIKYAIRKVLAELESGSESDQK